MEPTNRDRTEVQAHSGSARPARRRVGRARLPLTIAASVAWLLAYIMAQVSLLVLRWRHPEMARPFRMPGAPWLPLLAIGGMTYVVINSSPAPEMTQQIVQYTGIVLALFAVVGAIWVKGVMRKGLFEPTTPVTHGASQ